MGVRAYAYFLEGEVRVEIVGREKIHDKEGGGLVSL